MTTAPGWGRRAAVAAVLGLALLPTTNATAAPVPGDALSSLVRELCTLQWVPGTCERFAPPDPGYATAADPHPTAPFQLTLGAVHEHSGYSDGDPRTTPADYFAAARTGHNAAPDGRDTGVTLDFLLSSEHSENEKLPITTAAVCIDPAVGPTAPLACSNVTGPDHYRKWVEALRLAAAVTDVDAQGRYSGFTGLRGFEWTNDYFNHLGVYLSRNVVNAKVDGSYLTMERFWSWLRRPADQGGGADALVVFNHPGGEPALTPFDGSLPHNRILGATKGGQNWNDLASVPDIDDRVAGMEVRGGDDLQFFVRALRNGWHLGPVDAEDEHGREWASSEQGKTLVLTHGRSPQDYYHAFRNHRTIALGEELVDGAPGEAAVHPDIRYWAGGASVDDPDSVVLGGIVQGVPATRLELAATGLPAGAIAVLVSDSTASPVPLGTAGADGTLRASATAAAPATGEDWWFVVVCNPGDTACGVGGDHLAVTAPIWLRAA